MQGMGPDGLERSQQVLNNEINHKTFFEGDTFMADMIAAFLDEFYLVNDSRPRAQGREKHLSTHKTAHYKLSVDSTRLPLLLYFHRQGQLLYLFKDANIIVIIVLWTESVTSWANLAELWRQKESRRRVRPEISSSRKSSQLHETHTLLSHFWATL